MERQDREIHEGEALVDWEDKGEVEVFLPWPSLWGRALGGNEVSETIDKQIEIYTTYFCIHSLLITYLM